MRFFACECGCVRVYFVSRLHCSAACWCFSAVAVVQQVRAFQGREGCVIGGIWRKGFGEGGWKLISTETVEWRCVYENPVRAALGRDAESVMQQADPFRLMYPAWLNSTWPYLDFLCAFCTPRNWKERVSIAVRSHFTLTMRGNTGGNAVLVSWFFLGLTSRGSKMLIASFSLRWANCVQRLVGLLHMCK